MDDVESARKIADLEAELADLRSMVSRLVRDVPVTGPPAAPAQQNSTVTTRRGLLAIPVAAAGVAVAGGMVATATPAAAADGQAVQLGKTNTAASPTVLSSTAASALQIAGPEPAVMSLDQDGLTCEDNYFGYHAHFHNQGIDLQVPSKRVLSMQMETVGEPYPDVSSMYVDGQEGALLSVIGSRFGHGVLDGRSAVYASSRASAALVARAEDGAYLRDADPSVPKPGVGIDTGSSGTGTGLVTTAERGQAFAAVTTSTDSDVDGASVTHAGLGRALLVTATSTGNTKGAVTGVNNGRGAGVWGHQPNTSSTEAAVVGWSEGVSGRGGRFRGKAAQVRLMPGLTPSHPASGLAGDLYVDSANRLWFCAGATSWKQLA